MAMKKKLTDRISRREFARRAAAAAAAIAPACSLAGPPATLFDQAPELQEDRPGGLSYETDAEIEAKVQAILGKYGERLSDEQKAEIRRLVAEGQKPLAGMRAFALENADQPANVMKIYPDVSAPRRTRGR
ncbi:MAG TPA: hypothetical protein VEG64_02260 [Candidatus Sulfotelmatobacter sp.]|nr:hypothetical protein [Candidatus Sulfotelmatobacter sp.]